jgi:hypothetical protein
MLNQEYNEAKVERAMAFTPVSNLQSFTEYIEVVR